MQNPYFNHNNHSPSTPSLKLFEYKSVHKFKPILQRLQFHHGDSQNKSKKQKLITLTQQNEKHRYFDFVKKPMIKYQKKTQSSLPSLIIQLKSQSNPEKGQSQEYKEGIIGRIKFRKIEKKDKGKRNQSHKQQKQKIYQQKQKQSYKNSMLISLIQEEIDRNILYMQEMQINILSEIKKRRITCENKQIKASSLVLQKQSNKKRKQSSKILPQIRKIEPTEKRFQKILVSPEKIIEASRKKKQQQEKQLILQQQLRDLKNSLYRKEDLNKGWQLTSPQRGQIILHQNFIHQADV